MFAPSLSPLFNPRSVALVGASVSRTQGVNLLANLRNVGYGGRVYPVHPTAPDFMGVRCYSSIAELPEVPDCALFVLSSEKVVQEVERAGALGVRAAVIYASGFSELNEGGAALEASLVSTAKRYGMVVCGPNCMGLIDFGADFAAYTGPVHAQKRPGNVAILSHSGSGCVSLGNAHRFDLSYLVSSGNSALVDIPDYLSHISQDERTRVASLILEAVRNPSAFREAALQMYAAGKKIVALKTGRSSKGEVATVAHTGAIAGSYPANRYFLEDCGVIVVRDIDELLETTTLLSSLRIFPKGGAGVISISGGQVGMICDIASDVGLNLPDLRPEVIELIESKMRFAHASNPLDARTLSQDVYTGLASSLAADPNVAMLAAAQDSSCTLTESQAGTYRAIARAVVEAASQTAKPFVFINNLAEAVHPIIAAPLDAAGIPILRGMRSSIAAMSYVLNAPDPGSSHVPKSSLPRDPKWVARLSSKEPLGEREAMKFLADCGLRVPREAHARTPQEAAEAVRLLGCAVAMKVDSPDIQHKTEVGGVRLGVEGAEAALQAFSDIERQVQHAAPDARFDGVLIQEMAGAGVEILAGLSRQEPFGFSMTVGWGGVHVELLRDSQTVLLPTSEAALRGALGKTRVSALLAGYRGSKASDTNSMLQALFMLEAVVETYGDLIDVLEVNPLRVNSSGCLALDALMVTRAAACK